MPAVSHGLVTLFKYPPLFRWPEAVTVLRYIVVLVCMLSPMLGSAAAAPVEQRHELQDRRLGAGVDELTYDTPFVEEYCAPGFYRALCVGPVKPQEASIPLGATAVAVGENDTFAVVVLDESRVQPYGPYIIDPVVVGEDVRICYFGCLLPYPLFAQAHVNSTLDVWIAGTQVLHREGSNTVTVGPAAGLPLPAPFGCDPHQRQCDD